jgi:hypothetical protein
LSGKPLCTFPVDASSLAGTRERAGRGVAEVHDRTRPPSMEIGFVPEMIAPDAGHAAYFIFGSRALSVLMESEPGSSLLF